MSPPLTPDADEARRQLADELSKPIYADAQSWLADQWQKLLDWLIGTPTSTGSLSSTQLLVLAATAIGIAALAIWAFAGPVRTERRRRAVFAADEQRTADQLRADASRLATDQDWTAASMQLCRALVRSLAERTLIEETPGLTAHEAAGRAAPRLPAFSPRLTQAADLFDALAYGHRDGTAQQYRTLVELDEAIGASRPVLPEVMA